MKEEINYVILSQKSFVFFKYIIIRSCIYLSNQVSSTSIGSSSSHPKDNSSSSSGSKSLSTGYH
jgi:hypothetical protein